MRYLRKTVLLALFSISLGVFLFTHHEYYQNYLLHNTLLHVLKGYIGFEVQCGYLTGGLLRPYDMSVLGLASVYKKNTPFIRATHVRSNLFAKDFLGTVINMPKQGQLQVSDLMLDVVSLPPRQLTVVNLANTPDLSKEEVVTFCSKANIQATEVSILLPSIVDYVSRGFLYQMPGAFRCKEDTVHFLIGEGVSTNSDVGKCIQGSVRKNASMRMVDIALHGFSVTDLLPPSLDLSKLNAAGGDFAIQCLITNQLLRLCNFRINNLLLGFPNSTTRHTTSLRGKFLPRSGLVNITSGNIGPIPFNGCFSLNKGMVSNLRGSIADKLTIHGTTIDLAQRTAEFRWDLPRTSLSTLGALCNREELFRRWSNVEIEASGRVLHKWNMTYLVANGSLGNASFGIRALYRNGTIRIVDATLNNLRIRGSIDTTEDCRLSLDIHFHQQSIQDMANLAINDNKVLPIQAILDGVVTVAGTLRNPTYKGELSLSEGSYKTTPIDRGKFMVSGNKQFIDLDHSVLYQRDAVIHLNGFLDLSAVNPAKDLTIKLGPRGFVWNGLHFKKGEGEGEMQKMEIRDSSNTIALNFATEAGEGKDSLHLYDGSGTQLAVEYTLGKSNNVMFKVDEVESVMGVKRKIEF